MSKKTLLKTKVMTPKQVAANQANGQKSTGPRTDRGKKVSSQNGYKHGFYAQVQFDVMDTLREDPVERTQILHSLEKGYRPAHEGQQMVVEDIATLRWRRRQLERSQNAQMAERVKALELQRELLHLQINHDVADVSQAEILEKGLRRIDDCPAKFEMILDKLKALIQQVEECNYADAIPYLTAIYAKQASLRGASIFNHFTDLMRLGDEREEALKHRRPWPPPGDPVWDDEDAPTAKDGPGYDPRLDLPSELLLMLLNQEVHDVARQYQLFIEHKVTITQMNRDAVLAPEQPGGYYLAREIWMVDRMIDAKTRLLMKMKLDDPKWRKDEEVGTSSARPGAESGSEETPEPATDGPATETPDPERQSVAAVPALERSEGSPPPTQDVAAASPPPGVRPSQETRPAPQHEGPAATLPLVVLACVLGFMLGVRTRSAVRTAQPAEPAVGTALQLQGYVPAHLQGPRVRAVECGSAATALASLPALRANGGNSAAAAPDGLRSQMDKLQSAVGTLRSAQGQAPPLQPSTDDDFNRSEAADLLKTKDSTPGPNPLRTHFEKRQNGGQEEAPGDEHTDPSVAVEIGP